MSAGKTGKVKVTLSRLTQDKHFISLATLIQAHYA